MTTIVIQNGGFSKMSDLQFRDSVFKKGKDILDNLFNVQENKKCDRSGFITAKIFRTTSIRSNPYSLHFDLDNQRKVTDSRYSCVAGVNAICKHGAALYYYINNERSEGKTDKCQKQD